MTWVLNIDLAAPEPAGEDVLIAMAHEGEPREWLVSARAEGPGAHVNVYLDGVDTDPLQLAADYGPAVLAWARKWLPSASVAALRVVTEEQMAVEAEASNLPGLAGPSEAADLLGVSRQRLAVLRQRPDFPAPLVELAQGQVWARSAIEAFDGEWKRRIGRPPLQRVESM